jgi:Rps23 Pro-64 3,4-dihydroxylase Tpa1-like proline 4-hydroxylase
MYNVLIENFLTKEECEFIIQRGKDENLIEMKSSKIVNGLVVSENLADTYNNKRKGTYFVNEILTEDKIQDVTIKVLNQVNELKILNGIEYDGVPKYSFNEYSEGDFLNWHKDSHEIIYGATITLIIQLNDNYEGGEVMYRIDDVEYKVPKKQGSVFIFDSNLDHCVAKVNGGFRYSMNVWPSKKIKKGLI